MADAKFKVILWDMHTKNVGKIVSKHETLTNARKGAIQALKEYGRKKADVQKDGPHAPAGPLVYLGVVEKYDMKKDEYHWLPEGGGRWFLNKDGSLGKRLW